MNIDVFLAIEAVVLVIAGLILGLVLRDLTARLLRTWGRRFSGTFSSARSTETVIAVISRAGTIYLVDDDGHAWGTLLAPNRMELCYLHLSAAARVASWRARLTRVTW